MKPRMLLMIFACAWCAQTTGAAQAKSASDQPVGNYTLTIDGKRFELDLGRAQALKLSDGRVLQVTLGKKEVITYKESVVSFDHPSRLSPSRSEVSVGIFQTMMSTPLGSAVLIQEFTSIDPSSLIDMMLNELLKEEVQYGYKIEKSTTTKTLASGVQLSGKMAISNYKDKEFTRQVLCYQGRDAGLLIITVVEEDSPPEDKEMIAMFWKTLQISLPTFSAPPR
jgi:hypothetical protein